MGNLRRGHLGKAFFGAISGAIVATSVAGCANEAPPRPQLVVVVDIDVPLPSQLSDNDDLAWDTAIDTLRVDAFTGGGWSAPFDLRDFIAPSLEDWPLSFGVATSDVSLDQPVNLRLRAFRGRLGSPGTLNGQATIDPPTDLSIDRLVSVTPPSEGIKRVRINLHGDCLGVYNTFDPDPSKVQTCVDATRKQAAPATDIIDVADGNGGPTGAGSWPGALPVPCAGTAPHGVDAVCVPGGFSVLGDLALEGIGDGIYELDPTPLRPVRLSPFFMDRLEVTVGVLRRLLADPTKNVASVTPVIRGDPAVADSQYCTWLGASDASNDALPLNCIRRQDAADVCAALGGRIPSEAQWEHTARGRGRGTLYPWGDHEPGPGDCCLSSMGRGPSVNTEPPPCPGTGVEPAGSHPATPTCSHGGDQSRDGVLDLAGSLDELVADSSVPYDAPCWQRGTGALSDPVCAVSSVINSVMRGGNWNGGIDLVAAPFRHSFNAQRPTSGFRCVYPGGGL